MPFTREKENGRPGRGPLGGLHPLGKEEERAASSTIGEVENEREKAAEGGRRERAAGVEHREDARRSKDAKGVAIITEVRSVG